MTTPTNTAAQRMAQELMAAQPSAREALLVSMMRHAAECLRIIRGAEHASEEAYRLADDMAVRGNV
jgi:hypothetical protein